MDERASLLAWQWQSYGDAHRDRRNLLLHALTNPLFLAGGAALLTGIATLSLVPALGALAMPIAMVLQGMGHRMEETPPAPFRGPLDVVARIFAEQWITFPRFVLSGDFARAWRASR